MAFVPSYLTGYGGTRYFSPSRNVRDVTRALPVIPGQSRRKPFGRVRVHVVMNATEKEKKEFQDEEERRLQNDKRYVFREFGKISAAAMCIGLVLFFYDILVSLIAVAIGSVYAIAVLLEVRGANTLLRRIGSSVMAMWRTTTKTVQDGYRAIRREVRKGLED